jgi:hypothetical protein
VSAVATQTVTADRSASQGLSGRLFESSGSTLEDRILGAWEDLGLEGETSCPVCHGRLQRAGCESCGSALS